MSRAFVKEREDDGVEELPGRPVSPHPNYVTAEGLAQIEAELARAHEEHASAVATNDRAHIGKAARDLRYWTSRRSTAEVIAQPVDTTHVHFGATVTLSREDGRNQTYRIVGEDEADPAHGTLSHVAPLARALFGKKVGDMVTAGNAEMEIVEIR